MRERLLERMRREEKGENDPGIPDSQLVLQSVQHHLARLLNTARGSVPIADDYGIPDFFSLFGLGDVEALGRLERMLEVVVKKYEPRLKNVTIKVISKDETGLNLHLQLLGSIPMEGKDVAVSFETVLDSNGRVLVE